MVSKRLGAHCLARLAASLTYFESSARLRTLKGTWFFQFRLIPGEIQTAQRAVASDYRPHQPFHNQFLENRSRAAAITPCLMHADAE